MYSIGTDPEFFLVDKETNECRAAGGRFGGTKGNPVQLRGADEGVAVEEDNVTLELTIPACRTAQLFRAYMRQGITALQELVEEVTDGRERLMIAGCAEVSEIELEKPNAKTFGCSPEFDAYAKGAEVPGIDVDSLVIRGADGWTGARRFAGGHIHLGFQSYRSIPGFVAARFADVFIGLQTVFDDKQSYRRELYGQAGRFRPTPYGIEYRTPSSFWCENRGRIEEMSARAAHLAAYLDTTEVNAIKNVHNRIPWDDVQRIINNEDELGAAQLLSWLIAEVLPDGNFMTGSAAVRVRGVQ